MHPNVARITEIVTAVDMDTPEFLGAVCPPTFETSVFMGNPKYGYARTSGNPTNDALHRMLAKMENAEAALAVASGATAIFTALVSSLKAGDHVIMDRNAYGRALRFVQDFTRYGVSYTYVSMKNIEEVEAAIRPETTLIYLESPSSLVFEVCDIRAITALAKKHGIRTIMDNTYATPVFQNPIDMGVDVVIHSATKYLGGHSATIAGAIISTKEFIDNLTPVEGKLAAHEATKFLTNLRTLPLRMERHYENAKKVSAFFEAHDKIKEVMYPGSPNNPQRELIEKQMYGASGTMGFVLDCTSEEMGAKFINALKVIHNGGTWGTYESTINYHGYREPNPEFTTIPSYHCRLSVGLENVDRILEDLDQALRVM